MMYQFESRLMHKQYQIQTKYITTNKTVIFYPSNFLIKITKKKKLNRLAALISLSTTTYSFVLSWTRWHRSLKRFQRPFGIDSFQTKNATFFFSVILHKSNSSNYG